MVQESDTWYWQKTWSDFRRGSKRIKLSWDGGEAIALLYDEGVPETSAAILKSLPLSIPVVHAAWSGDMLMSARPFDIPSHKEENRTRLPRPGDLAWDPKYNEMSFAYGTAEARLPSGTNILVIYACITEGLDDFAQFCRARRFEGISTLRMSLVE